MFEITLKEKRGANSPINNGIYHPLITSHAFRKNNTLQIAPAEIILWQPKSQLCIEIDVVIPG